MEFFSASRRSSFESMDILLIGAAPPPNRFNEREFRMFSSVKQDLQTMYNLCHESEFLTVRGSYYQRSVGLLNVRRCLINNSQLAPTKPADQNTLLEGTEYGATTYDSVGKIRSCVKEFIEGETGPNLLIYFSGHGNYQGASHAEESLTIPVQRFEYCIGQDITVQEHYTAAELSADINQAVRSRAESSEPGEVKPKVYVVIDACHAEGLINMWRLDRNVRLDSFVVLFAGAETKLDSAYDNTGGKFTTAFARHLKKGIKLSTLAQYILEDLYDPAARRSPCVRYGHPSLCDERFLVAEP